MHPSSILGTSTTKIKPSFLGGFIFVCGITDENRSPIEHFFEPFGAKKKTIMDTGPVRTDSLSAK